MVTSQTIYIRRPHEAIPTLTDETAPGNVASPADRQVLENGSTGRQVLENGSTGRQVLENGSTGRQDCRPKTTLSSIRAAIAQVS